MRARWIFIGVLALAFLVATEIGFGETALDRARQDLRLALEQFEKLKEDVTEEEAKLIEEVELLDDRVLELSKELRDLEGREALVTKDEERLDLELEKREVEFGGYWATFNQYRAGIVNRLHVSESQHYEDRLASIKAASDSADEDLSAKVRANIPMLGLGTARLLEVGGGQKFEGKAAGPGNTLEVGNFALFGPLGFLLRRAGRWRA